MRKSQVEKSRREVEERVQEISAIEGNGATERERAVAHQTAQAEISADQRPTTSTPKRLFICSSLPKGKDILEKESSSSEADIIDDPENKMIIISEARLDELLESRIPNCECKVIPRIHLARDGFETLIKKCRQL